MLDWFEWIAAALAIYGIGFLVWNQGYKAAAKKWVKEGYYKGYADGATNTLLKIVDAGLVPKEIEDKWKNFDETFLKQLKVEKL